MKIGYDAKRLFANATGLGNYSRNLVQNVQHFYPENEYHLYAPAIKNKRISNSIFSGNKFYCHESKTLIKAYWRSFSIVKDLEKEGIELYHGLSNELPFNLNKSSIKSVVTIHDLIFKLYPETYSLPEQIIYNWKFKYACQNANKIIAISESTKNDIIRFYGIAPAKIEVIYQVCNPIFYTLQSNAEQQAVACEYKLPQKYFLYVGSVEKRKNLKLIIEAYHSKASELKIPLIIVGRGGGYKKECKKLIAQYGLQDYFIWLENLKDNIQLQAIYQQATALIYPSFYEGFGLPIAEALLCKTPVIAANTSSLKEAGGADSIYIDPLNAIALSEAMHLVLNNAMQAKMMSEKGYVYAHKMFAPEKFAAHLQQLYLTII